ncbi:hypothetical protein FB451DRAFT_1264727 [Mycena latifolia]|nr:hypothetical protein FB451DRAFT_1264727 [Mycena latifolia]
MHGAAPDAAVRIAAHLGLTAHGFEHIPRPAKRRAAATEELRTLLQEFIHDEGGEVCDVVIAAFCAKFLPSLVAAYRAAPHHEGPYHHMLGCVMQNDYFAKFMRSPPGADLYAFYVDQILRQVHERKRKNRPITQFDTLKWLVCLLILATYAQEYKRHIPPLPEDVFTKLFGCLATGVSASTATIDIRAPTHPRVRPSAENVAFHERIMYHTRSVIEILRGGLEAQELRLGLTRRHAFNFYARQHAVAPTTRRECARCQTAVYCCKEHQREDWKWHKKRCFETAY